MAGQRARALRGKGERLWDERESGRGGRTGRPVTPHVQTQDWEVPGQEPSGYLGGWGLWGGAAGRGRFTGGRPAPHL